ncbi:MAG: accessory factor UbiK family protein [Alphaproteobacteria bacterium]
MPNKTFVEDMLSLGSGVLSNLAEARHELKSQAKQRAGSVARGLDLVSREEFDAAFAMIAKARNMQEDLSARLSRIENHLNLSSRKTSTKNMVKTKKKNLPSVKTKKSSSKGR